METCQSLTKVLWLLPIKSMIFPSSKLLIKTLKVLAQFHITLAK